ncbi:mariner Mos1 transposase [Trichonephila clavipes]|uniref:Mariner Mos1 transposase n=1 Tax=Trichonephila clavipes TaxID=2585209 RepID=A0A8X7BBW6_TRICX|nr:mariner Mos1 transposase [Trichonephila clavipes]
MESEQQDIVFEYELRFYLQSPDIVRLASGDAVKRASLTVILCIVNLVLHLNGAHKRGLELLEDDAQPGQAHHVITPETIVEVNVLVLESRRITVDEILRLLGINMGTEQCNTQIALSLNHLHCYYEEKNDFLSQIVTDDETGCHHFEPESESQSKQWKCVTSTPSKKSKVMHTSSGKVMGCPSFDQKGPLLAEFLERKPIINVQRYQAFLQNLRRTIKSKCPGMLSNGVILLHDNVHPHTANAVKTTLQQFQWKTLGHPLYSSVSSPCDFHVFRPLK